MPEQGQKIKTLPTYIGDDNKEETMLNMELINERLKNSLKRSEKALTELRNLGNTTKEGQKLMQRISKEMEYEEEWLKRSDKECINKRAMRIGREIKTYPAAYTRYLEMAHRRPGKGRSKTVR